MIIPRPRAKDGCVIVIAVAVAVAVVTLAALFFVVFPQGKNLVDVLVPAFSFSLLAAVGIYALLWPLIELTDDRISMRWFEIGRAEFARARLGRVRASYNPPGAKQDVEQRDCVYAFEFMDTTGEVVLARLPTAQAGWIFRGPWRASDIKRLCERLGVPYVA